jgi:hypothetical protein
MKLTTEFARGLCIGVGLVSLAAVATLRGLPNPRLWRSDRIAPNDRSALDRAARLAQESRDYLDMCRAAGI